MGNFDLRRFDTPEPLAHAAALDWVNAVSSNPSSKAFSTALAGGRIALNFFAEITAQVHQSRVPLNGVHFFWGDERCVPPTDPESNFRAANELLLGPMNVSPGQIHRLLGENSPEQAAKAGEGELRRVVSTTSGDQPVLDLVLLGMGEEGHIASLFPGEPEELVNSRAVYRCVTTPKPPPQRITLGYPALAAARQVWVLVSGAGKEVALRQSLGPEGNTPLARLLHERSSTRIYSDCKI
jgi:6-phosphogluconolactonase